MNIDSKKAIEVIDVFLESKSLRETEKIIGLSKSTIHRILHEQLFLTLLDEDKKLKLLEHLNENKKNGNLRGGKKFISKYIKTRTRDGKFNGIKERESDLMENELNKLKLSLTRISPILEGLTIEETAAILNISPSSVDKALKYVRKNAILLPIIDEKINPNEFLNELDNILKNNTINARKSSHKKTSKGPTWNCEDAKNLAYNFLANGLTLRKAAPIFGYSKTTILEILNSIDPNSDLYHDVRSLLRINVALKIAPLNGMAAEDYDNALSLARIELINKYTDLISIEKKKNEI